MPRYNNYFRSHLFPGDPRTPLTAAGGCTWPTMPAHRYALTTTTAYGVLSPLNNQFILIEKVTPGSAHDACQWNMISAPMPVLFCIVWKRVQSTRLTYTWSIGILASACGIMEKDIVVPRQPCNVNFPIGNMECTAYYGGTGANFSAEQVVYNKTAPPV